MKKQFIVITVLTLLASGVLLALNMANDAPNRKKNGFTRDMLENVILKADTATFENHFTRACGWDSSYIYFSGTDPGVIYRSDHALARLDTLRVTLPDIENLAPVFTSAVFYPKLYVAGGNARVFIEVDLEKGTYTANRLDTVFSFALTYRPGASLLRTINSKTFYGGLLEYSPAANELGRVLEPFGREAYSFFSYDGQLGYDDQTKSFIYMTSYANKIVCFDTLLNVTYRSNTIDTTRTPTSIAGRTANGVTHAAPPTYVNNELACGGGNLYVFSNLMADNEQHHVYNGNNAIDCYRAENGNYAGSFYLPRFNREPLLKMYMAGAGRLIALYKHHIVSYSLKEM